MTPTVIDLFCGIGGLGLGAARAGFRVALSVDLSPIALEIHKINFPGHLHSNADVSQLSGAELLAAAKLHPGQLTGLIGGSPCQGFSRIGKRQSGDERNSLFAHFFRLVAETRPSFFVAENVPGILDSINNTVVAKAHESVRDVYRLLPPLIVDASDFGAPTTRTRVFFVGVLPGTLDSLTSDHFQGKKWAYKTTVATALAGLPKRLRDSWLDDKAGWRTLRVKRSGRYWEKIYGDIPEGVGDATTIARFINDGIVSGCVTTLHSAKVKERYAAVPQGGVDRVSRSQRLHRNGQCPTIRAGTGPEKGSFQAVRPLHFSEPRVISPREAARLQGFPDWFRFHPTKWHAFRGIGNSVSPFVSEAILATVYDSIGRQT